tara:strand:+ start:226 stop:510 length:285 start_codon:yes stop_codon:yes gene_type:complete
MCVGGGGGSNRPPQQGQRDAPESESAAVTENKNRDSLKADGNWSEGYLGGAGSSGGSGRKDSYWKNNPTWDQQWYDKGYKKGDWVSTRQSDRTS